MVAHDIVPGSGQLLVFTEFTDTARWLAALFRSAGFSTEVLDGGVGQDAREDMQTGFLAGRFQVLVSTDAGGEGIDLQSAHVMIDWDIPWSLVRLEQRAGRLHRIGQARDVHVYHLIAPDTLEGRVQQVMLDNLTAASRALNGRIYDLLDATVDRAGFNFGAAMAAAHSHPDAAANVAPGLISANASCSGGHVTAGPGARIRIAQPRRQPHLRGDPPGWPGGDCPARARASWLHCWQARPGTAIWAPR